MESVTRTNLRTALDAAARIRDNALARAFDRHDRNMTKVRAMMDLSHMINKELGSISIRRIILEEKATKYIQQKEKADQLEKRAAELRKTSEETYSLANKKAEIEFEEACRAARIANNP